MNKENLFLKNFIQFCEDNKFIFWLEIETLKYILKNKNIFENFPIKFGMLRADYEKVVFKMNSCDSLFSVVICENGSCSIKVFDRKEPKSYLIEIIPYDYIDCNSEDKKEIGELNKTIQIYRNALAKISNNKDDKADFVNYLNIYRSELLKNKQNNKNCLMVGLDYQITGSNYVLSKNSIFPLKKQTCDSFTFYVPNNFELKKEWQVVNE